MGFFGAAHGLEGGKKTPLPNICHTYPTKMKHGTWRSYTLPKEDPKLI